MKERIVIAYQKITVPKDAKEAFFHLTQALNSVYGNFACTEDGFTIEEGHLNKIIEVIKG
jgi:hypothetical protein